MSNINTLVKNEMVIPYVDSDLFRGHEDSRFAIGMLAMGNQVAPKREDEFTAYLRLRARVYADQTRMISQGLVRSDGTEMDVDDARSVHFGLLEQKGSGARVVGALRLIMKGYEGDDRPLPIEEFFSEAFQAKAARTGSVEASRYIARHEVPAIQDWLSFPLFSAGVSFIAAHRLGPTYGTVEPKIEAALKAKRVPLERIAEPVYVPEYSAENLGIVVDTEQLASVNEARSPGMMKELLRKEWEFTYFNMPTAKSSLPSAA